MRILLLFVLLLAASCIPKPEEVQGCPTGQDFNEDILECVSSTPEIVTQTIAPFTTAEDAQYNFSIPVATTTAPGSLYYFIDVAPLHGKVLSCANRATNGSELSVGSMDLLCTYSPTLNYVGTDSFSYKVCTNANGSSRCADSVVVNVTVGPRENDAPTIAQPSVAVQVDELSDAMFYINADEGGGSDEDEQSLTVTVTSSDQTLIADGDIIIRNLQAVDIGTGGVPTAVGDGVSDASNPAFSIVAPTLRQVVGTHEIVNITITVEDNGRDGGVVGDPISGAPNPLQTTIVVPVRVNAFNFPPVFPGSGLPQEVAMTEDGGAQAFSITAATDADGETVTYSYVSNSLSPSASGTLADCIGRSGSSMPINQDLTCTFTPSSNWNGTANFKVVATDGSNTTIRTVNLNVAAVNDPPVFFNDTALDTIAAFNENSTGTPALPFKVEEGGGTDENAQAVTLDIDVLNNTAAFPLNRIIVRRAGAQIGTAQAIVALDGSGGSDATGYQFTLEIRPADDTVTMSDTTIRLTLADSGGQSIIKDITIPPITNVDDAASFVTPPPTIAKFNLDGVNDQQDLVFRASEGANDMLASGDSLTVLVTSSSAALIDLTNGFSLSFGGAATIAPSCTPTACSIAVNNTDPGADHDLTLSLTAQAVGTGTISVTVQDAAGNGETQDISFETFDFVASFAGWRGIKAEGRISERDGTIRREGQVTVDWNDLNVTLGGGATSAYRVLIYRENLSSGEDDYASEDPIIDAGFAIADRPIVLRNETTFEDDQGNFAAGVRYNLRIRVLPDALGYPIDVAAASDQVLGLIMPPDEMVMIHRWMANKHYCEEIGLTPDRANNYTCNNIVFGNISGGSEFDQRFHLMVDRYEAGCLYDTQNENPIDAGITENGRLHYDRSSGSCELNNAGSLEHIAWGGLPGSSHPDGDPRALNRAGLPPIVNLRSADAQALCQASASLCDGANCADVTGDLDASLKRLPTRREAIIYGKWNAVIPGGFTKNDVENGGDLATYRGCNVIDTDGQTGINFVDSGVTVFNPTLTGTESSGIRSLVTGADQTVNCESIYGVHDHIGNVDEFTLDRMDCAMMGPSEYRCDNNQILAGPSGLPTFSSLHNASGFDYIFDNGAGADMGRYLNTSPQEIQSDFAGFYFYPSIGVPATVGTFGDGVLTVVNGVAGVAEIGDEQLSGDTIGIDDSGDSTYHFTSGGPVGYGSRNGRYTLGAREMSTTDPHLGYRCVIEVSP